MSAVALYRVSRLILGPCFCRSRALNSPELDLGERSPKFSSPASQHGLVATWPKTKAANR